MQFKNNILGKIDRFEGNIYNSSMIPIVVRIQQIFREKRKQRALVAAEESKIKSFKRSHLKKAKKLNSLNLDSDNDDEEDISAYIKKKTLIATSIK